MRRRVQKRGGYSPIAYGPPPTEPPAKPGRSVSGLARPTRERDDALRLFEVPPDWREHWWGMPAFDNGDARPAQRITVNFISVDDVAEFARRLGVRVTPRTDSMWFPGENLDRPNEWEYADES